MNTTGSSSAPSVDTSVTVVVTVWTSVLSRTNATTSPTARKAGSSTNVSAADVTSVSHDCEEM